MSTQDVGVEALLNIWCIVKRYHLCRFEVNVGEVFTANKKRGERAIAFKVVNHRGQLEKELRDSKDSAECNWAEIWSHYDYLAHSKRHT